jgi:NADP-dependent 3-hydroxy acid dehydrogenase YdfG
MVAQPSPQQRVALITGASSGIGSAAALMFAGAGMHIGAVARRIERLAELEAAGQSLTGQILPLAADVRDPASLQAAVDRTVEQFGRLDVLVANAGLGQRGSISDADWDDLETLLRTNIDGVLHSVRAAVPALRQSGGGQIILISSIVFNMTMPYAATYAASKAFVSSMARSLRLELLADNISVTDVRLGRTDTEFNEKRLGKPGRASSGFVRPMPVEQVAAALLRATHTRPQTLSVRPLDSLIVLANRLVPNLIGRMVIRQYR